MKTVSHEFSSQNFYDRLTDRQPSLKHTLHNFISMFTIITWKDEYLVLTSCLGLSDAGRCLNIGSRSPGFNRSLAVEYKSTMNFRNYCLHVAVMLIFVIKCLSTVELSKCEKGMTLI